MSNRKRKSPDYSKYQREGFVPEQDGGWAVRLLEVIDGFVCHEIKKRPDLSDDQWVEVIHRNGERSVGPAETFAWGIYACAQDIRFEYGMPGHRSQAHDILDLEITHYRTIQTPPANWVQGQPWPFEEDKVAA